MGNICRSPLAEGVFRHLLAERGWEDRFEVDSAGTSGWHQGAPPDRRSAEEALRRGVRLSGASRAVALEDLERFDYLIAMDGDNLRDLQAMRRQRGGEGEIRLLREFEPEAASLDVPDPYFGGGRGFAEVHDIVERGCRGLLDHLARRHGLH
jgi:protein-tyrosine phosphatase